jgi:hypothetical protein
MKNLLTLTFFSFSIEKASSIGRGFLHYALNFPFSDKSINDRKDVQSVSLVKLGDFQDAFFGGLVLRRYYLYDDL